MKPKATVNVIERQLKMMVMAQAICALKLGLCDYKKNKYHLYH
jgi:hypothetical protein